MEVNTKREIVWWDPADLMERDRMQNINAKNSTGAPGMNNNNTAGSTYLSFLRYAYYTLVCTWSKLTFHYPLDSRIRIGVEFTSLSSSWKRRQ